MNVLIIDDEYYARKAIMKLLESLFSEENVQIHIFEFRDAETTMSFLRQEKPVVDAAFTDIRMNDADGLDLCEYLRQYNSRVCLVIISGYEEFAYAQRAMKSQVLAYLTKPVNLQEIRDVVLKIIRLNKAEESSLVLPANGSSANGSSANGSSANGSSANDVEHTGSFSLIDSFHQKLLAYYLSQGNPEQLMEVAEKYFSELIDRHPYPQTYSASFLQELAQICGDEIPEAMRKKLPKTLELLQTSDTPESSKKIIYGWLDSLCLELRRQVKEPRSLAEKAHKYIEDNYNYDIRLESIAGNIFYVHPNYLSKVLKKQYGKSFCKILLEIRMKNALRYLQRGNLSVSTVAQFVGYNSESHFVQTFKKFYGYTPGNVCLRSADSNFQTYS